MLDRPLELRFDESSVRTYGVYAQYRTSSQLRVELDASRYDEDRKAVTEFFETGKQRRDQWCAAGASSPE
jgi:hypothetical protein